MPSTVVCAARVPSVNVGSNASFHAIGDNIVLFASEKKQIRVSTASTSLSNSPAFQRGAHADRADQPARLVGKRIGAEPGPPL
jgi:hypothetical protein